MARAQCGCALLRVDEGGGGEVREGEEVGVVQERGGGEEGGWVGGWMGW